MRSATQKKTGKDPEYLEWIRSLPCVVCVIATGLTVSDWVMFIRNGEFTVRRKSEAAHVGSRGLSQKCPDRQVLPMCCRHHTIGANSHHVLGKKFWSHHNLDRAQLIADLQAEYENQLRQ